MTYVSKEELEKIQGMNADFSKAKMALGELELNKHGILNQINAMRQEFSEYEKMLILKYGQDSVINLQTGEVTQKQ
tara:strand:- start:4021 stop:4248 length:228 start_codon:yes stop_codon:yes gene_type:complete